MQIEALQLESRFSLPPNSLGYCGRNTAPEKFKNCIINGNCMGVEEEVKKFIVLYPYLKTLSEISKKTIFSYSVIESYWIGNDLLTKAKSGDYNLLLKNFLDQGVPDFFVAELKKRKPKKFIPSHLFHVLHVGVGKASGAVPFNLDSINNCMIRWGSVQKIQKNKAVIDLNSLKIDNNKYVLTQKKETISYLPEMLPDLKPKDIVAVHWKMIIKIMDKEETQKIEYWTKEVLTGVEL